MNNSPDEKDDSDMWREHRLESQERRKQNRVNSIKVLIERGIPFQQFSDIHYLVADVYDFWPSTGKFIHRKTKETGRGVFNLIKKLVI